MLSRFNNRVALVTGAGSGIGQAVARQLAREGAFVYCADLNSESVTINARECHGTALLLDVTEESAWQVAIQQIQETHRQLDILVHCAGISAGAPLEEMRYEDWLRVLNVNLNGAFLATKHCMKSMKTNGGVIVHVSSASGITPASGAAAYSVSKAGLGMLTRVAAKECRERELPIRINAVCPAGVKTPMWSTMPFFQEMVNELGSEEAAFAAMAKSGGGAFADPDEIVSAILFLASNEARVVTGAILPVDGGYSL